MGCVVLTSVTWTQLLPQGTHVDTTQHGYRYRICGGINNTIRHGREKREETRNKKQERKKKKKMTKKKRRQREGESERKEEREREVHICFVEVSRTCCQRMSTGKWSEKAQMIPPKGEG